MLQRKTSTQKPTNYQSTKKRDISRRAKFRRAFKLSIVIPDDSEKDVTEANIGRLPLPKPLWSPSSLEVAVQKVVKKNYDDVFSSIGSPVRGSSQKNFKGWPGSPSYRPLGPDGKKWQFFDEAAYDNVFGKNDSKELKNIGKIEQ